MNRRDLLLKEMGISQWQLYRPKVFKGAVQITVAPVIHLLIIGDHTLDQNTPILKDILLSAQISVEQCLFLTFEQAQHLSIQFPVIYWFLTDNLEKVQQLTAILPEQEVWHSCSLTQLTTITAKRKLWADIQASLAKENYVSDLTN